MTFWRRLFGLGKRSDSPRRKEVSSGYRILELPSDTPGEAVLLKASFIEPLIRKAESRMSKDSGPHMSEEEKIVAFAAELASLPESRLLKLMEIQADDGGLVHRFDDIRGATKNPLPPDWACPGFLVTLFRL